MPTPVLHINDTDNHVRPHDLRTSSGQVRVHILRAYCDPVTSYDLVTVGPDGPEGPVMCSRECGCP